MTTEQFTQELIASLKAENLFKDYSPQVEFLPEITLKGASRINLDFTNATIWLSDFPQVNSSALSILPDLRLISIKGIVGIIKTLCEDLSVNHFHVGKQVILGKDTKPLTLIYYSKDSDEVICLKPSEFKNESIEQRIVILGKQHVKLYRP